ncbi:unnamed protein product [Ixodes persulcatus]
MAASDDNFDQFDDELPEGSEVQGGDRRKRLFSKELRCMMYGFGDDQNPYTESVDLLEDLVIEFIIEMDLHHLTKTINMGLHCRKGLSLADKEDESCCRPVRFGRPLRRKQAGFKAPTKQWRLGAQAASKWRTLCSWCERTPASMLESRICSP